MEFVVVGWPEDGPQLDLDHREFAYAGKFVMTNTGKAVAREDRETVAAVAFNADRTDESTAWLRYVTVRDDRRGEGIGAKLADFATKRLLSRGFKRVRIAVNNPFAYEALYKAGFGFTGEETGLAELVLERPTEGRTDRYRNGLSLFEDRDLPEDMAAFVDGRLPDGTPPEGNVAGSLSDRDNAYD
ncbi:MAG: GNAT family N-acetyltransferase [Halodesulfurarchaeum sp.]